MLKTKRLCILLTVIMLFSIFIASGCKNPYNITMYNHAGSWLEEEFKYDTHIDIMGSYPQVPDKLTFVIKDKETYDSMFVEEESEIEVDFATEMVVLYVFGTTCAKYIYLVDAYIEDNNLIIKWAYEKVKDDAPGLAEPGRRWLAVKLDRLDVDDVFFKYTN